MRGRTAFWIVVVMLGLGVASSACRPREVTLETPVGSPEKTTVVVEQETVQVILTSTPTRVPEGGTITRATFADATTANPLYAADDASRLMCDLMFEGLLRLDPLTGEFVPGLAEKWTISDDGLTYTFAIRRNMLWSDGQPITARDLYFTYAALLSGKLDTPNNRLVANIVKIEVLDDYTAAVVFKQANCGNMESLQLGWIPMHAFTQNADAYDWNKLATHEFNGMPTAVSGPFVLKEWVRGERWVQVRNARYWQGAPHLEGVVTRVLSGQAEMVELLKKGEVDIGVDIRPQYLAELEQQSHLRLWKFLSDGYDLIGFQMGDPSDPQPRLGPDGKINPNHGAHPILEDVRVRQAIAYALDREEIVARARLGQGVLLQANVLPTVGWAYNTDLEPRRTDPEKAGDLLNQAGWVLNEATGIRSKEGMPLKLRLHTNAGNPIRETMAALIQAQLRKVGIQVELIPVEYNALLDVLLGQTFDMVLINWSHLGMDPDDTSFWSAESDVPGKGANFVSYYSPEVEAWLAEASAMPGCDQDRRAALYRQIQARLYEDQPYCWLDMPRNLVAISKRIGGINPGPWDIWHGISEWYVAGP